MKNLKKYLGRLRSKALVNFMICLLMISYYKKKTVILGFTASFSKMVSPWYLILFEEVTISLLPIQFTLSSSSTPPFTIKNNKWWFFLCPKTDIADPQINISWDCPIYNQCTPFAIILEYISKWIYYWTNCKI